MIDRSYRNVQIVASAIHEAGHAMAALRAGCRIRELSVSLDHPGNGYVAIHKLTIFNPFYPGQSQQSVMSAWNFALENVRKEMRIILSGPIAEARFVGGDPLRLRGAEHDRSRCQQLVNRINTLYGYYSEFCRIPAFQGHNILNESRIKANRWMNRPKTWNAILAIAIRASQVGVIESAEIGALIGAASGIERQRAFILN